jgi:hypothetical protein
MRFNLQIINSKGFLDKIGATVSWACAVHCLAMPFVISFLPLIGLGFLVHEEIEYVFIGLSVLVAAISLLPGFFRLHRNINTLLLFITGISFVASADKIFGDNLTGKMIFVFIGAGFITTAHFLNRYLCKKCENCEKAVRHPLT